MKFGGWQGACRYETAARDAEVFASVATGLLHSGVRDLIAMGIFAIRQRRSRGGKSILGGLILTFFQLVKLTRCYNNYRAETAANLIAFIDLPRL